MYFNKKKREHFSDPEYNNKKAGWYEMENYDHCNGVIHVVEKGDTLYKLSKHYKCNLCDIITANPYVNVYNMQEGEENLYSDRTGRLRRWKDALYSEKRRYL